MKIGERIKIIRKDKKISQSELANKMGISQQSISQFEKSDNLKYDTLKRIAEALGISEKQFINIDFENYYARLESNEIYEVNCDASEIQKLEGYTILSTESDGEGFTVKAFREISGVKIFREFRCEKGIYYISEEYIPKTENK